ncbi:toll-like receptor 9 isoform X2 [Scomber scombrus]|uniref:toll-like receptor 9 isoform X2 n=1 Tax=Scomber scombrus TaxID=13677 RepID=UPI002DDB9B71|nr:toll-like receptor 9 isoform X2 [Scomber scombrus]
MALLKSILILSQLLPLVRTINTIFFPCDTDVNTTTVDCYERPLTHVPPIKSTTVVSINLSRTKIQQVWQHDFSHVPNLETLEMMDNCLPVHLRALVDPSCKMEIHRDAFKNLLKLKILNLSGNSLTSIPLLPKNLKVLDLKNNRISHITEPLNTPHLEHLFLCKNCFYANPCNQSFYINETVFKELPELTNLTLGYNNLTTVPKGLPPSLKMLDLKENTIMGIFERPFANLMLLQHLNIEWNCQRCDHAARPCFPCPQNRPLFLHANSLYAENSSITYLSLRGNSLKTFPEGLFRPLKNLKKLDVSDNFLAYAIQNGTFFTELKGLTWISLIYNYEPLKTFQNLSLSPHIGNISGLQYLLLSGNFFHTLSRESLEVLSKLQNLKTLELRMNFINTFDLSALEKLRSLKVIDLSQNMLNFLPCCPSPSSEIISQQSCQNQNLYMHELLNPPLIIVDREVTHGSDIWESNQSNVELKTTLKVVDISNNEFHFKMRGMGHRFEFIQNLTNLEVLSLANNGIGMRIDQRLTSSSLKYLYFYGNHLDIMWDSDNNKYTHFFQNLTNLIYLDISNNELKSISPEVMCNFPESIKFLSISYNLLNYFPWLNISALSNLYHLNLSQNFLFYLPRKDIEFGVNFSLLDLSHNRLSVIPEDFFKQAKSLQYLYLNHNQIKELNHQYLPAPFKNGSALQKLTLHANPFKCDCDTSWFADFLRTTPVQIPYLTMHIHCQFPESQQSKSVLSMDQRSCQDIYGSVAFLVSFLLAVIFTVLPLLKHLYGWDLWYCLQVLWAGQKGYSQLASSDSQYHYDAFVVFDTSNQAVRDWVYNELTVHLENSGHRRFCLCLEERDWIPGLSCIENLHSAVYNSVKTVFVLSSGVNGGETVNGVIRQAFFMVQQRLLDEKVDVAVLVLLDEMFPKLKYLQLRKRLCRKSVLSWPRNPRAQPLFWNRIRMNLSSDNLKFYDNNMSESFI